MSERYYHASSERTILQMTTSKEGLIISVMARALDVNGKWNTITLNAEQLAGLRKFINET